MRILEKFYSYVFFGMIGSYRNTIEKIDVGFIVSIPYRYLLIFYSLYRILKKCIAINAFHFVLSEIL